VIRRILLFLAVGLACKKEPRSDASSGQNIPSPTAPAPKVTAAAERITSAKAIESTRLPLVLERQGFLNQDKGTSSCLIQFTSAQYESMVSAKQLTLSTDDAFLILSFNLRCDSAQTLILADSVVLMDELAFPLDRSAQRLGKGSELISKLVPNAEQKLVAYFEVDKSAPAKPLRLSLHLESGTFIARVQ
jgi:hypothetical protein